MRKVNKSWMAVVAAVLLLGTLVGVVWARPNDRPQAADITRKVTLTGADFIPTSPYYDYANPGGHVYCVTGSCSFTAPIVFPCLPSVTVERIKLHVSDSNAIGYATATVYRANPSTGTTHTWAAVSSPSGASGGLQTYTSSDINQVVWPSQKAFVGLHIGSLNINVYGVTVEYHRNI